MSASAGANGVSNSISMKLSDRLRRAVENGALPVYIFLILLIIPNVILGFTEKMPLMAAAVNVALPLAVYYLLLTLSPRLGRTIWLFFPVIFLDAFQIVLLWLYKRSVIAVDMFLNLVTTNPGEAGELLGNMLPSIIIVVVLYVPPLAFATVMLCKGWNIGRDSLMRQRRYALWLAIAAATLTVAAGLGGELRFRRDIFPINALDNARLAGRHAIKLRQRAAIEPEFSFDARSVRPDSCREVIVLVVGETSRADHWALNGYGRPTNPRLMRLEADSCGRLVNFRRSLSQSNTTHKSVPLLLTHLTPENYADSIYSVRSVISAFKEAGYSTAFVTAQKHNRSFIEFFGNEADTTIYIGEDSPEKFAKAGDLGLLDYLDSILAKGARKQLVVLHCYGSHFSYRDRYPADMARFTPDSYSEISTGERDALINAYDNTIVATDSLLSGIARRLEHLGANAAMIYSSDHGEDILDDSRGLFLHASPCPTFYQVYVPFIVWISNSYVARYPEISETLTLNSRLPVASGDSFTPTALGLAGITTPRITTPMSVTDSNYRPLPRRYLNDHNECIGLMQSGFIKNDCQLTRQLDRM